MSSPFICSLLSVVLILCHTAGTSADDPSAGLFRSEYHRLDLSFCNASVCVDFDGDGSRELLFASRATGRLEMLHAADGRVIRSQPLDGAQQSLSAHDVDGDGDFEIFYTVSGPGRLYQLDHTGRLLGQWEAGDWKLGHSPVVLDADGDGQLDGLLGTRSRSLVRLNMTDLSLITRRDGWVQCGCHTSAMDVDRDGLWDLFAGSGDDSNGKGVLHRYDPRTLNSVWSFETNDNASSADAVLVDLDGDGDVEIVKSVDNYGGDDAHDGILALQTDGTLLWKRDGLSGEDSPNVADLDGDGIMEVVGMTFGCEVYCLDSAGRVRWRRDLRPELSDESTHAYLAPILCDVNGDRELEILACTNGGYFDETGQSAAGATAAPGIVFALSASGDILDRFEVAGHRYWGDAYVVNLDDDPALELVLSGSGGLDVIETSGRGPNIEHFQRRRSWQRLNVLPWAYSDTYFIHRGVKEGVVTQTDNLVLERVKGRFRRRGRFVTERLDLPPDFQFDRLEFETRIPDGTDLTVNVLNSDLQPIRTGVSASGGLGLTQPVHLEFVLSTSNSAKTPLLDSWTLTFNRRP